MRSVAALLLILGSVASLRASTDRGHPAPAARSLHHLLLPAISAPDHPSPASPSSREPAVESAFDEEETTEVDPLHTPPRAVALDCSASPRPESSTSLAAPPAPIGPRRPGLLRC
jgi:hypothetical protein